MCMTALKTQQESGFLYEPSILRYFLMPSLMISFFTTIFSFYVLSPLIWSTIFGKQSPVRSNTRFSSLLSSTTHAIISSALSLYLLVSGVLGTNRCFSKDPLGFATVQISLGFWFGDLIILLIHTKLCENKGSLFHHITAILGLGLCLFLQGKAMFFTIYRFISAISVPFGNFRWALSYVGYKTGVLYSFSSLSMSITFILCRIVTIPWHWYEIFITLYTQECALILPLSLWTWLVINSILIDVINMYWIFRMGIGAYKLYSNKVKASWV